MTGNAPGIVADGFMRLLRSPWYRQKRAAIKAQVREKFRDELSRATGYWQRIEIEHRIFRKVKRELNRLGLLFAFGSAGDSKVSSQARQDIDFFRFS
jgi:hypothetical protein